MLGGAVELPTPGAEGIYSATVRQDEYMSCPGASRRSRSFQPTESQPPMHRYQQSYQRHDCGGDLPSGDVRQRVLETRQDLAQAASMSIPIPSAPFTHRRY